MRSWRENHASRHWKALTASHKAGTHVCQPDDLSGADEVARRLEFQAKALVMRLGREAVDKGITSTILTAVAEHVAVSGRPRAGTAFQTMSVELTEDGIFIPMTLDLWTEDALLLWKDIPFYPGYEHLTTNCDPEPEELHALMDANPLAVETIRRCSIYFDRTPKDDLDKSVLLSKLGRFTGNLDQARYVIDGAFNSGSYAWAALARERRRKHNPVRWWAEPATRPFMRVLREKAIVDLLTGTEFGAKSWLKLLQVILALDPSDPLEVREELDKLDELDAFPTCS